MRPRSEVGYRYISGVPTFLSGVPSLDVVVSHHNYIIRSSTPSRGAFFLSSLHPTIVPRTRTPFLDSWSYLFRGTRLESSPLGHVMNKDRGWDGWMDGTYRINGFRGPVAFSSRGTSTELSFFLL